MRKWSAAVAFAVAGIVGAIGAGPAVSATPKPFYAVQREYVKVPAGVMPWDPSWSPDGTHILFQDDNGGYEWIANADGTGVHCLTCGMSDHPAIVGGFSYIFPDNRRMFLANELGDSVYILDCTPDLFDCRSHAWLPVDLSGDATTNEPNFGRRTYHLAPDGVHVGYTITRPDGLVMMVAALQREAAGYKLVDYHVVNPPGPSGPLDTNPDGWANGGSLDELKAFADGGRKIVILAEPDGIPQQEEVDLATGQVTQLTAYPDWNEDGAISPDGDSLLTESWRTENRLTALGLMPLARSFINLSQAIESIYYVSSRQGFACDLQPWLLPAGGDQGGTLVGQPLNPYGGGATIPANDLEGQQVWSPDSTRVLLQGRSLLPPPAGANSYLDQKGPAPNELMIAHILRPPTAPIVPVRTQVGSWAPTPQRYQSSFDMPGTHVVNGKYSGTAVVTIGGNIGGGDFSVVYHDYSDDGRYFLNGTQTTQGSVLATVAITDGLTATDATGIQVGYLDANLQFSQIEPAPTPPSGQSGVSMSGTVSSSWLGQSATGLPMVGPCPQTMPRASALELTPRVRVARHAALVTVSVSSDVYGDTRPVQGATVVLAGRSATTDAAGVSTLRIPLRATRRGRHPVTVAVASTAGDTFLPAWSTLVLPAVPGSDTGPRRRALHGARPPRRRGVSSRHR